jgi:DNA-binding MarR family transcriptional regulator
MAATTVPGPRDPRLEVWRTFLQAHFQIRRHLEQELQEEQQLSLGEYEVLLVLAYADGRRKRMSELAEWLMLSRSGATRVIDRMQVAGLVDRVSCETDRRGQWAQLTDAGYDRLRGASPTHLRGVGEHFLNRIRPDDLATLGRILGRVTTEEATGS